MGQHPVAQGVYIALGLLRLFRHMGIEAVDQPRQDGLQGGPIALHLAGFRPGVIGFRILEIGVDQGGEDHAAEEGYFETLAGGDVADAEPGGRQTDRIGRDLVFPGLVQRDFRPGQGIVQPAKAVRQSGMMPCHGMGQQPGQRRRFGGTKGAAKRAARAAVPFRCSFSPCQSWSGHGQRISWAARSVRMPGEKKANAEAYTIFPSSERSS